MTALIEEYCRDPDRLRRDTAEAYESLRTRMLESLAVPVSVLSPTFRDNYRTAQAVRDRRDELYHQILWDCRIEERVIAGTVTGRYDREHRRWREREDNTYKQAYIKSIALLKEWLSPNQLWQFNRENTFDVVGNSTYTRYTIRTGTQLNISFRGARMCVVPKGAASSMPGDVMLAQKIALETNEEETRELAHYARDTLQEREQINCRCTIDGGPV